jgi:hypothetical protein
MTIKVQNFIPLSPSFFSLNNAGYGHFVFLPIYIYFMYNFRNLSVALIEEINKPLKQLVEGQIKARKPVSMI